MQNILAFLVQNKSKKCVLKAIFYFD